MRCLSLLSLTLMGAACLAAPSAGSAAEGPIGKKIEDFSLHDFRGKVHSLKDYADSKGVVVAFIGIECPLARLYAPRLAELAAHYEKQGVTFIAVDSNRQDSVTELGGFAQRHKLSFPVLKDPSNEVADLFGAERTPEVYLLDSEGVIRYHGRVDDQYGQHLAENNKRISYQHTEPKRRDLAIALDELLAGEEVSVAQTDVTGCIIGRIPEVEPGGDVTYSNQIARILQDRCVECHRDGEIAPFALTDYDEVVGWSEMIREVVQEERMPPWHANPEYGQFQNDCRLSNDEKQLISTWVDNGSPEGDPNDLPEPRQFTEGWGIDEPDQVIYMSDKPYDIPAEGTVEYQYFEVDPGWKEDKWIKSAEARPDNRAVVHHIIGFIRPPAGDTRGIREGGAGIGYAPGMPPRTFEPETAMFVPAGSKIVFQMHYTPNGRPQKDRSYIGVVFADEEDVKFRASGGAAMNTRFEIPAGADNHQVTSDYEFEEDRLLLGMLPHMHLRGKSFRFIAEYPDGESEILLDVPRYDFNWQLRYDLVEPKLMPAGTRLHCIAHFDNSEDNLSNPDPSEAVTWGDQTWEEMMIGWFTTRYVDPVDHEKLKAEMAAAAKEAGERFQEMAKGFIARFDKDDSGTLSKEESPEQMQRFFNNLDTNRDGQVDADEALEVVKRFGGRRGGRGEGRRGGRERRRDRDRGDDD